ncbi:MAG TPA: hypothetical protein VJJ75_03565 [Candidatus Nanoarchaeia archaeon]|nr:hypothetical protein [Candidatus Nanoarchaeia archaeon]
MHLFIKMEGKVFNKVLCSKKGKRWRALFELVKAIAISLGIAVICLALVATLWQQPLALAISLLIVSWWVLSWHKQKEELLLYIIIGIGGPLGEIIAIHFGAWSYSLPQVIGIPIWLPPLWALAGVLTKWSWDEVVLHYKLKNSYSSKHH